MQGPRRPGASVETDAASGPDLPLVAGRICGTCTACCLLPTIDTPELKKPPGVLCPHCTGTACGIYERRPQPCRTFHCLWRRIAQMPDAMRPDRIGVMFSIEQVAPPRNPFERLYVVGRAIASLADFETPGARAAIDMFVGLNNIPVWLSHAGERRLLHPGPDLRDAILAPDPPPPALAAAVRHWRGLLAPPPGGAAGQL